MIVRRIIKILKRQDSMKPGKSIAYHKFTIKFLLMGKDDNMKIAKFADGSDEIIFTSGWRFGLELLMSMSQFMLSFSTSFILLMNLMKLGLYQAVELEEEGFNVLLWRRTTGYDKIQKNDLRLLNARRMLVGGDEDVVEYA
ncbi:hypothetical protein Tco_0550153 [Tanacetum coccineum]